MVSHTLKIAFFGDSLTQGVPGGSYFEILKDRLPQHHLINHGKGGDTVISLYRRLLHLNFDSPPDLGFLWIGINDVFVKTSPISPFLKTLRQQRWAKNHYKFGVFYKKILEFIHDKVTFIYTVPPLLIGEDIDNPWNRELEKLSEIINNLSHHFDNVEYIDIRRVFISQLLSENPSRYVPKSILRIIWDKLSLHTPEETEQKAKERGWRFTLDGVHLNHTGAQMVADIFLERIKSLAL